MSCKEKLGLTLGTFSYGFLGCWSVFPLSSPPLSLVSSQPVVTKKMSFVWACLFFFFFLAAGISAPLWECFVCFGRQMICPSVVSGMQGSDQSCLPELFCWLLNWPLLSPAFFCPFLSFHLSVLSPLPDVHALLLLLHSGISQLSHNQVTGSPPLTHRVLTFTIFTHCPFIWGFLCLCCLLLHSVSSLPFFFGHIQLGCFSILLPQYLFLFLSHFSISPVLHCCHCFVSMN